MSGTPTTGRAPGSFSPMVSSSIPNRPYLRRVESSSSEDSASLSIQKQRSAVPNAPQQPRPLYAAPSHNSSSSSLQNFSRPTLPQVRTDLGGRAGSPLTISTRSPIVESHRHGRKHSQTQGSFEPYLPTAANSNLANMANADKALSASQIAAQAAMQHQPQHLRSRSQTVPAQQQAGDTGSNSSGSRRPSRGPASPPVLSLTEASGPRSDSFGAQSFGGQSYHNGLLGGNVNAAQTAANMVFPRSPSTSPGLPPADYAQRFQPEKPAKPEKPKVKLFSRPGKVGVGKEKGSGALSSPSKAAFSIGGLQKANMSTNSLADSMSGAASLYSMANSSSATIKAIESPIEPKDKEKKHHFLSRQKNKLSGKDDHHLPLSSAASNSRPVDPSAPSSLYNFSLPPSPGPASTSFAKSMSGLDLRHGGRALREKKKEEKSEALRENELLQSGEWLGLSSIGSAGVTPTVGSFGYPSSIYGADQDMSKYGLNNMGPDDAWPYLKAKLLIIFEGEDLRLPVEDFNRLVSTHIQRCIAKRTPNIVIEDLRDLLQTGFSSLDQTLRRIPEERLIPHLVEMWLFTFTSILPYIQAVFLPLDQEFTGSGLLMTPNQAHEFWGALPTASGSGVIPASQALEVRRLVLTAYRDTVIIPRFDTLKMIFSRLSLESIALNMPSSEILSTSPDSNISGGRPSTAMSLDPSTASYGSQNTTLLGGSSGEGSGSRSRAVSNVSYGSDSPANGLGINMMPPPPRPFTPSSTHPFAPSSSSNLSLHNIPQSFHNRTRSAVRQVNEDSSNKVTETVGRMLQCMSVLLSVGTGGDDEDAQAKMEELTRGLKLNWLGRGRTGRNRRGLVGARIPEGGRERGGSNRSVKSEVAAAAG